MSVTRSDGTPLDVRGLSSFLIITFAVTYAIEGVLIANGFRISREGPMSAVGQYVILAVMWVPALATVLTIRFVTREGFSIARIRFGPWRRYVAVGLVIPACFLVIYGLTWVLGLGQPDWTLHDFQELIAARSPEKGQSLPPPVVFWAALYVVTLIAAPFFNSVFGFGEELGWRGYLLPKLMPLGKPRAYLLVGIVWGLWHLPLVLVGFTYPGHWLEGTAMFLILTTAFGVYLNELTLRNGSSILAGWAHGVFNSQKLGIWSLLFPGVNPLLGGYAGAVGLAVWTGVAAFASRSRGVRS